MEHFDPSCPFTLISFYLWPLCRLLFPFFCRATWTWSFPFIFAITVRSVFFTLDGCHSLTLLTSRITAAYQLCHTIPNVYVKTFVISFSNGGLGFTGFWEPKLMWHSDWALKEDLSLTNGNTWCRLLRQSSANTKMLIEVQICWRFRRTDSGDDENRRNKDSYTCGLLLNCWTKLEMQLSLF